MKRFLGNAYRIIKYLLLIFIFYKGLIYSFKHCLFYKMVFCRPMFKGIFDFLYSIFTSLTGFVCTVVLMGLLIALFDSKKD